MINNGDFLPGRSEELLCVILFTNQWRAQTGEIRWAGLTTAQHSLELHHRYNRSMLGGSRGQKE